LAIYLGYVRAGWPGLVVGGTCFIMPAAALLTTIAWTYARFGSLPEIARMLYGLRPAVVAIIIQALWQLGQTAVKDAPSAGVTIAAVALSVAACHPLVVLLITGITVAVVRAARGAGDRGIVAALPTALAIPPSAGSAAVSLESLFLVFLKLGARGLRQLRASAVPGSVGSTHPSRDVSIADAAFWRDPGDLAAA